MTKTYSDEMLEVAIRHAGHEFLSGIAADAACDGERVSGEFDRRMRSLIGAETARRHMRKAGTVALRVAAVVAVIILVMTAAIFSSEALRIKVVNLFYHANDGNTKVSFSETAEGLPEGIVLPTYVPEGFALKEASVSSHTIRSLYENAEGNTINISQGSLNTQFGIKTEGSYPVDIAGTTAYVVKSEEHSIIIFNNDRYSFIIYSDIDVSELLIIAESIINS